MSVLKIGVLVEVAADCWHGPPQLPVLKAGSFALPRYVRYTPNGKYYIFYFRIASNIAVSRKYPRKCVE
eukprot:3328732-Amphidinium_carterae.1